METKDTTCLRTYKERAINISELGSWGGKKMSKLPYFICLSLSIMCTAMLLDKYANQNDITHTIAISSVLIAQSIIYAALIVKNKTDK